jgi:DNA topoisomerase IB
LELKVRRAALTTDQKGVKEGNSISLTKQRGTSDLASHRQRHLEKEGDIRIDTSLEIGNQHRILDCLQGCQPAISFNHHILATSLDHYGDLMRQVTNLADSLHKTQGIFVDE